MKLLFYFEKGESVRWLGHLDILRTFERAIRRADLPVAFSAGFNPRERVAFASALGVGITALREPATIELTEPADPEKVVERLNAMLPPGLRVLSAEPIADARSRDLLNSFSEAEYEVLCDSVDTSENELARWIADVADSASLPYERQREGKTRPVDLRPFLLDLRLVEVRPEMVLLQLNLSVGNAGSARPAEIVDLLRERGADLAVRRITRTRLVQREAAHRPKLAEEKEDIVERDFS